MIGCTAPVSELQVGESSSHWLPVPNPGQWTAVAIGPDSWSDDAPARTFRFFPSFGHSMLTAPLQFHHAPAAAAFSLGILLLVHFLDDPLAGSFATGCLVMVGIHIAFSLHDLLSFLDSGTRETQAAPWPQVAAVVTARAHARADNVASHPHRRHRRAASHPQ